MNWLTNYFKNPVENVNGCVGSVVITEELPLSIRPSDAQMEEWLKEGFVTFDPSNNQHITFQWVNWALEQEGIPVRVGRINPSYDMLEVLFKASKDYMENKVND